MWSSSRPGVATTISTPAPQRAGLPAHAHAAAHGDAGDTRVLYQRPHIVFDLHCELTSRSQDHHARPAARRIRLAGEQALQDRQQERHRLAGARLRAGDQILAGGDSGEHRALHGRGLDEAQIGDRARQARVEIQRREINRRGVEGRGFENRWGRCLGLREILLRIGRTTTAARSLWAPHAAELGCS